MKLLTKCANVKSHDKLHTVQHTNTPSNFCSMFKNSRNEFLPAYDLTLACFRRKIMNSIYTHINTHTHEEKMFERIAKENSGRADVCLI